MTTIKLSRRSANYSKAELDCLLRYLEDNPDLVSVRLGGKYSSADDFRIAWDDLADRISSLAGYFGTRRTGQEIKRKWSDLKSRVKAKAAALAIEADKSDSPNPTLKLSPIEERVLAIISRDLEDQSQNQKFDSSAHGSKWPLVKVFSFQTDSNSEDNAELIFESEEKNIDDNVNESEILEEIKVNSSDDKKRRISEAFSSTNVEKKTLGFKRLRFVSEEEQLQALCDSQLEVNAELRCVKEILKKCQQSIEKIALLKRAELRLKCAKYGVEFEDLFD